MLPGIVIQMKAQIRRRMRGGINPANNFFPIKHVGVHIQAHVHGVIGNAVTQRFPHGQCCGEEQKCAHQQPDFYSIHSVVPHLIGFAILQNGPDLSNTNQYFFNCACS